MRLCSVSNMWLASIQRRCILYSTSAAVAGSIKITVWLSGGNLPRLAAAAHVERRQSTFLVSRNGKLDCFSAWKKQLAPILLEENWLFQVLVPGLFYFFFYF